MQGSQHRDRLRSDRHALKTKDDLEKERLRHRSGAYFRYESGSYVRRVSGR